MTFDSTLRSETNDPKEIQKADFDLLEKINRVGRENESTQKEVDAVEVRVTDIEGELATVTTVTIDASYTIKPTDRLILVNTNNATTITVPTGLPIGHEFTVQRISSGLTTNAVTLSGTGLPFTSMFGNTILAKTNRHSETFTFRQIAINSWSCVSGCDSGGNANGRYYFSFDGKGSQEASITTSVLAANTDQFPQYSYANSYLPGVATLVSVSGLATLAWGGGITITGGPANSNPHLGWQTAIRTNAVSQAFSIFMQSSGRWY